MSRSRRTWRAVTRRRSASTAATSSTSSRARSEGIGIRVIRDGRTGFAYAGTLDSDAIAEVLAEARDNVEFGTVDEWAGLAEPDGVPMTEQSLWNDALAEFDTDSKIDLAKELEKLTTGVDPRVRVDEANYADGSGEAAVATTTGIRQYGRENGCYVSVSTLADDGDETQTGFGFSVGREPAKLDVERGVARGGRSGDPSARGDEATVPTAHGRPRPVRDRPVPRRSSRRRSTARPW